MNEKLKVRLRKPGDDEIYGPMDLEELKHLANTAYLAPEDKIAFGDSEDWKFAHECEDLGMFWIIEGENGSGYGPTSLGTVREFLVGGEVKKTDRLKQIKTGEVQSVEKVLGAEVMALVEEEIKEQEESSSHVGLVEGMEIARDIRIRNLEAELELLQKEHDDLKQKYLQVAGELIKSRKA